ncbi:MULTISPECIES: ATP-binding protein [Brevibacillus]|uniref:ATP-binding protein n=1 Tax=Brevibacillus TaxID=55080 RepID=UPI000E38B12A|nr:MULTISPECIES: sensor histidine kinase [Brevibacillus]RED27911.1 two-component system sporulation sensor kinase B [Brevibacillus brevis]TQK53870.1 two-component system sporulation sensor kinase B [Brevibacillus sp. AG162]GEC88750.1 sensor histidine kinase [Brevibacillus brevis]VEF86949.1 Sporulation kinase E [Brevibacillus brevis]
MSLLKEVILQWFFAIIPFVFFNIYYRDKMRNYSRSFIVITSSACMFLAMTFAPSVTTGMFFDIRHVIILFGLVYGGIEIALLLLIEALVYRYYLGGEGTWVALLILTVNFVLSLFLYRHYKASYRKTLYLFMTSAIFSTVALGTTYYFFPAYVTQHLVYYTMLIPIQNFFGLWLLMSLFSKCVSDKELFIRHAQNEKIQTMSHVAASLAHEVRNPLTAVKGFLKLIQECPENLVKVEQYIRISLDEIQRTEAILTEYLAISKPLKERHEIINVSEHLHAIREVMLPFANMHNVELTLQDFERPVTIKANPDEFKQVLVNFIKNAIEACADISDGKVSLDLLIERNKALLVIKDNGVGMDAGQISRLGTIYFSTKTTGTGLGLTYSYHVIHAIGGTVNVTSKPRVGTKFTIMLPYKAQ